MRDMLILSAALLLQGTLGFYAGLRTERARQQNIRERAENAKWSTFMRDCYAPPTPRNAPLKFNAASDASAARVLIEDSARTVGE
jgi:hypothetical protein